MTEKLRWEDHLVQPALLKTGPTSKSDLASKLEWAVVISYFAIEIKFCNMTLGFLYFNPILSRLITLFNLL